MKSNAFVLVIAIALSVFSCESKKTITTESGTKIDFVIKGDSVGYNEEDIVLLNMLGLVQDGDTLFNTKSTGFPLTLQYIKEQWSTGGVFYEVLENCGNGDSLSFSIGVDAFFTDTFKTAVPDSLNAEDLIVFTIGIADVMTEEAFQVFRTEKTIKFESSAIDKYLEENNLVAEKTETGLTYIITQQGTGAKPQVGDNVSVHYRGAFLDDREFDSSIGRGEPFEFPLGQGRVIKGWDEGVALMNVGSKATFLVPSTLGYGERGAPGAIPPNSILKFDVELLEIK